MDALRGLSGLGGLCELGGYAGLGRWSRWSRWTRLGGLRGLGGWLCWIRCIGWITRLAQRPPMAINEAQCMRCSIAIIEMQQDKSSGRGYNTQQRWLYESNVHVCKALKLVVVGSNPTVGA